MFLASKERRWSTSGSASPRQPSLWFQPVLKGPLWKDILLQGVSKVETDILFLKDPSPHEPQKEAAAFTHFKFFLTTKRIKILPASVHVKYRQPILLSLSVLEYLISGDIQFN